MTTPELAQLNSIDVSRWLARTATRIDVDLPAALHDTVHRELQALIGVKMRLRILIELCLLDDCMRVAHLAMNADGLLDDEEMRRTLPLAHVAMHRFELLPHYSSFSGEKHTSLKDEASRFLLQHRNDTSPLGNASPARWHGLRLCRRVAELANDPDLVRQHEQMLFDVMEALFVGRHTEAERLARRELLQLVHTFNPTATTTADRRLLAFCSADAPDVFAAIAQGSDIFEPDDFDIECIHESARDVFHAQLEQVLRAHDQQARGRGKSMVILGDSGCGKTHLLRALRTRAHSDQLAMVGYLQLLGEVTDTASYVRARLVDSLEHPHLRDEPSSLMLLSQALLEYRSAISPALRERLQSGECPVEQLPALLGPMVDQLVRSPGLAQAHPDVLQALLLLQVRDAAISRRVVRYLRGENLSAWDQQQLGGLTPRHQPEHALDVIAGLGHLMMTLRREALVVLIDQTEDAFGEGKNSKRVQQVLEFVRAINEAVPTSIVVLSCLTDVWSDIRPRLAQSILDRVENDPPPVRLSENRTSSEIEAMLKVRLSCLYAALDVPMLDDDPYFPFVSADVDALNNTRTRDVLLTFQSARQQAIATGKWDSAYLRATPMASPTLAAAAATDVERIERDWNAARAQAPLSSDDDIALLLLLEKALHACRTEGHDINVTQLQDARMLLVSVNGRSQVIAWCNEKPGTKFCNHINALLDQAKTHQAVPLALRSSDFNFTPTSNSNKKKGELRMAHGAAISATDDELRALNAFAAFVSTHPERERIAQWRVTQKPLSRLRMLAPLFVRHEAVTPSAAPAPTETTPRVETKAPAQAPAPSAAPPIAAAADDDDTAVRAPKLVSLPPTPAMRANEVRVGVTPSIRREQITLNHEALLRHAAFLGGSGSGKTTLALSLFEQLLAQGIPVVLLDRKGDLARYASNAFWQEIPPDPDEARRKADLHQQLDIDLYTPGDESGRPLQLSVIPTGMASLSSQERDQEAKAAAAGLAAMLNYGTSESHRKKTAILQAAIDLAASNGGEDIEAVREPIASGDHHLVAKVGNLTKLFNSLMEDIDMLRIQRGDLLQTGYETLDVARMFTARAGRARLSIISLAAVQETSVLQFWVSRFLLEVGRLVRAKPKAELQGVLFLDEADAYIPATSAPPTKEPLFDLLRRARSGGVSITLATQNPGDIDYKARDNIGTWFLGRIGQKNAIEKMRTLLGNAPGVANRLASQTKGAFVMLSPDVPGARDVKGDLSLLKTVQLSTNAISELAKTTRPPTPPRS